MAGGRPTKYSEAEDMQQKINAYFSKCATDGEPLTITGLAMALNLSRQGLCEYAGKPDFSDTVKRAKQTVELEVEKRLFESNCTGSIFWLKNNAGWKDKTENEITGKDGSALFSEIVVKHVKTDA